MQARTAVEIAYVEAGMEDVDPVVESLLALLPYLTKMPDPHCRHCAAGVPRPHVHEAQDA